MTFQHRTNDDELHIRFHGAVTHDDIVDCCVEMAADPKCQDLYCAVIDFSSADDCSCSASDLSLLATTSRRLIGSRRPDPRVIFIVPSSEERSQHLRLQVEGRVELCGTDAQARDRIEGLRRSQ